MDGSLLAGWENFYVIVGSCAGGLTGLTFVVIALIRDVQRPSGTGLRAFLTPTIVHFGWNVALPALVYGGLLVMALLVWRKPLPALYGVAAASLLLLFIGIRNAWDLAVWMTVDRPHGPH